MKKNQGNLTKSGKKKKNPLKWILTVTALSFIISVLMAYVSSEALANVNNLWAFVILLVFISIGILFDIIGIAAASGDEKQFHSMAARKVSGSREVIWMLHNAEKVTSICNDVIGDIAGIISGATGTIIIASIIQNFNDMWSTIIQLVITGCIAALTIGGKAAGKGFGMRYSNKILFAVGKIIHILPFVNMGK
jgi:hypothetical protein